MRSKNWPLIGGLALGLAIWASFTVYTFTAAAPVFMRPTVELIDAARHGWHAAKEFDRAWRERGR